MRLLDFGTYCISILSVLIWVQTVCKGYQQMTKVSTSKERLSQSFNMNAQLSCKANNQLKVIFVFDLMLLTSQSTVF